ncbi:hypothetical protein [Actinoplanes couchii]|uniref:Lipoprotein n=1 Tax=Actinoplanes couchii TaxID=403638 RepID=A0ABQ3X843_9ACTN|nr:hypothetical protein [Actinoplanes couchii]MDR6320302.1 hypothetical protein [Actinoplanes couchii]GID54683.1 hypothetical protein Aco03nite_030870 [Actinoplanes couchii]
MLIGRRTLAAVAALMIAGSAGCSSIGPATPEDVVRAAPEDVVRAAPEKAGASDPLFNKVAVTQSEAPVKAAETKTTEVYALGVRADAKQRTVTFDEIEWFTGKAARAACQADKVEVQPSAWCHDFYYRNPDDRKRTAALAESATVTIADYFSEAETVPQKKAGLSELDERLTEGETLLVLTVRDGVITGLREQFTP